jgi:hypothetical protein
LSGTTDLVSQHASIDSEGDGEGVETDGGIAPHAPGPTSKVSNLRYRGLKPPRTLELTLFERLEKMFGPRIKCMLTVQYRCVTRHDNLDGIRDLVNPQDAHENR